MRPTWRALRLAVFTSWLAGTTHLLDPLGEALRVTIKYNPIGLGLLALAALVWFFIEGAEFRATRRRYWAKRRQARFQARFQPQLDTKARRVVCFHHGSNRPINQPKGN